MTTTSNSGQPAPRRGPIRILAAIGLPLLVLAGGGLIAYALVKTAPQSDRKPPARAARLVEVEPVRFERHGTVIRAMGTVRPAREVALRPRVAGEIVEISPELVPGGRFKEGQMLARIDPTDFELAVRERESDVAQAKGTLALEMGQQTVAQHEFDLLGESIAEEGRDLVLRKPQLAQAQARLDAAQAALDQARLNLNRTTVRAPFNATIRSRDVNVGMQVNTTTLLATLSGSDEYWVEVTVPVNQLRWIDIPTSNDEEGSRVRAVSEMANAAGEFREGRVLRLLPDLEDQGLLARLLVSVPDPLGRLSETEGFAPLILGDFVRVEIEGIGLESAAALNRSVFHDGDQVWIMTTDNRLEVRPVTVAFRGGDTLFVTNGIKAGEKLVVTDLPSAVEGMTLRTQEDAPSSGPPDTRGEGNRASMISTRAGGQER